VVMPPYSPGLGSRLVSSRRRSVMNLGPWSSSPMKITGGLKKAAAPMLGSALWWFRVSGIVRMILVTWAVIYGVVWDATPFTNK
jgi:hypothetical protein